MTDSAVRLVDAVRAARAHGQPLVITGSHSKPWLTAGCKGEWLETGDHRGITAYRPDELVLTALSGTPLTEIETALAEHAQMLPFDAPQFGGGGTLGGAVAAGLAGPARPWRGGVRDAVLGVEMINGRGERLAFGGQVMKNVAGYDLSRLQAGAHGTLGVLLAVSVRVNPAPEVECTLAFDLNAGAALRRVREYARTPWPVTATWYSSPRLCVRLSGCTAAVAATTREFGGEVLADPQPWTRIRDRRDPFFAAAGPLWRVLCPPSAPLPDAPHAMEWGGALRWLSGLTEAEAVRYAKAVGGAAHRADQAAIACEAPAVAGRLKYAFDPQALFNRGLGPVPAGDDAH